LQPPFPFRDENRLNLSSPLISGIAGGSQVREIRTKSEVPVLFTSGIRFLTDTSFIVIDIP